MKTIVISALAIVVFMSLTASVFAQLGLHTLRIHNLPINQVSNGVSMMHE